MSLQRIAKYWALSWGYFAITLAFAFTVGSSYSTNFGLWITLRSKYIPSCLEPAFAFLFDPLFQGLSFLFETALPVLVVCWLPLVVIAFPVSIAAPFAWFATYIDPIRRKRELMELQNENV